MSSVNPIGLFGCFVEIVFIVSSVDTDLTNFFIYFFDNQRKLAKNSCDFYNFVTSLSNDIKNVRNV